MNLRWDEQWARECVVEELPAGTRVEQNDDNSEPGMYDLKITYPDGRTAALEVTSAANPNALALGKLIYGQGRWIAPGITKAWWVDVLPTCNAKRLRKKLPALLSAFEAAGITEVDTDRLWERQPGTEPAKALDVVKARYMEATDYPGSIYLNIHFPMEMMGGFVPDNGNALAEWISGWCIDPARPDNLAKLAHSGEGERHLFVIVVGLGSEPFAVTDMLIRDSAPPPEIDPVLPDEVTHVWIMSTWGTGSGFRWAPDAGWLRFNKMTASTTTSPEA
jgi:hypothetical protein